MKNVITFIVLQIVIVAMWVVGWYLIEYYIPADNKGVFGDQFGSLTSLFSAMAFGGIIYSIIIQTRELLLTREELTKATEAQTLSSEALIAQLDIQKKVALISAVTNLIELYEKNKFLQTLDFKEGEYELKVKHNIDKLNSIINSLQ